MLIAITWLLCLSDWIIRSDWARIFSNQELTSSSPERENGLIVGFWIIFKIIIGHMSINEADRLNYSSQSFWRFWHFYSCDRRGSVIQIKDKCRYFVVSFFQVSRLKKQVLAAIKYLRVSRPCSRPRLMLDNIFYWIKQSR